MDEWMWIGLDWIGLDKVEMDKVQIKWINTKKKKKSVEP